MQSALLRKFLVLGLTVVAASACGKSSGSSASATTTTSSTSSSVTTLSIYPTNTTIAPSASLQLYASGGTQPYTYSLLSGGGSLNPYSGQYIAPSATTSVVAQVRDSAGATASASIYVSSSSTTSTPCTQPDLKLMVGPRSYGSISISCSGGCVPTRPDYSGTSETCWFNPAGSYGYIFVCYNSSGSTIDVDHITLKCSH